MKTTGTRYPLTLTLVVLMAAVTVAILAVLAERSRGGGGASGIAGEPQEAVPFRLGTFRHAADGADAPEAAAEAAGAPAPFVGIVLGERLVIDLAAANEALPPRSGRVASPTDMKDLITRWEEGVGDRVRQIVATPAVRSAAAARAAADRSSAVRGGEGADDPDSRRSGRAGPRWMHDVEALRILPPILYPTTMMNVAVNYREHDIEMATVRLGEPGGPTGGEAPAGTESAPGIWERDPEDPRWNPYMFLKAPASIIAHGEAIRIPPGRTRIEWECELSLVIGATASRVPLERAQEHIFGYTLMNDVSDRGGRGDQRYGGSDWLIAKSHDTFAPLGPFITPREFVPDVRRMRLEFRLNDEVLQEGTTAQMIHGVDEMVVYASNILTLRPGDIVATGTLPGAGSARTPPVFFRPGDVSSCTFDGIGTLENPIEGSGEE